jgi:hypothetical protein
LSGAAIGGIVVCLTVLLLVIVSSCSIGGYLLYRHCLRKKSQYCNSLEDSAIGMSFKNGK